MSDETQRQGREQHAKKKQAQKILRILKRVYPDADCALHHKNPFELLVATMLSAQSTDKQINKLTPALFARFPDARSMSKASLPELEKLVYSSGFYKNKAKNLLAMSKRLCEAYDCQVPDRMEDLLSLPGVARKTANVVLGNAFHKAVGIVVDTHVGRIARRFGWTREKDPVKVEKDLMALIPKSKWIWISHALIHLGRGPCQARKPHCMECPLEKVCPKILD
ncbi:MAG TPA: endonuclease III [Planctomycetes bacterium]|nr:endonuclease III [Planctomycetota bacterium]